MKIIAGQFGGRSISMPNTPNTRPITLLVRGAIFNVLGDSVADARVLDFFAGSGALGLEALSRGASHVVFVELGQKAYEVIKKNVHALDCVDTTTLIKRDVKKYLDQADELFDIIFLDPPYNQMNENMIAHSSSKLTKAGVLVVSHSNKTTISDTIGTLERVKQAIYGDTVISYYRKN